MSDMLNDSDREARVRRAMRSLADAHQPVSSGLPTAQSTDAAPRRRWLMIAASLLVVGGVVAVYAVAGRDTSISPVVTDPTVTDPSEPSSTPNADDDVAIDPTDLRFSEPLPDGTAAFVNDTSLGDPSVADRVGIPGEAPPPQDSVRLVVMDGPRLLMIGIVADVAADIELDRPIGPAVEIGVDGATYIDDDEGAIVIPIDGGRRIVGPRLHFTNNGGGPYIDPEALLEIATAISQLPIDQVDQLPGFFVDMGSIGGESLDPIGLADAITVEHSQRGEPRLTLYRLAEPPTTFELLAIANSLLRGDLGELDTTAIESGRLDFASTSAGRIYMELVSPVDLVVLSSSDDLDAHIAAIDFAPLADLAEAFDGSVEAPPPPLR